ncbi:MAG: ABC transporter ATP-binding protein [Bdellovibrionaceae bacterium]|nr:ABC transporter ATP-binding protein [Pseudobdellovibrionaceae bacterium]
MNSVLKAEGVKKNFYVGFQSKKVEALKGLNFEVPAGTITCFLGPNGSGKSTFIKIATNLVSPTEGRVLFFGDQPYAKARSRVGYVPEKPEFPGFLTPVEILKFVGSITSNFEEKRILETLELVDLAYVKDRRCKGFSKGMNQRLALAQALLSQPDLLILDEPFNGLDPESRLSTVNTLNEYAKSGKSVFLTSHLLEDVQKVCDFLVVIRQGQVRYMGDVKSLVKTTTFSVQYKKSDSNELHFETVAEHSLGPTLQNYIQQNYRIWSVTPDNQELTAIYKMLLEGSDVKETY